MSDLKYWLAFNRIPGIGRVRFSLLEEHFGTLEPAWSAGPSEFKASGLDERTVLAITSVRSHVSPDDEMGRLATLGMEALTWHDSRYPPRLR